MVEYCHNDKCYLLLNGKEITKFKLKQNINEDVLALKIFLSALILAKMGRFKLVCIKTD